MTTTPSPELPDLDREVLRTHARRVFEQRHDVDDTAMDELIAYVRTALARRAQPEGEAPCDCCADIRAAEADHGDGPEGEAPQAVHQYRAKNSQADWIECDAGGRERLKAAGTDFLFEFRTLHTAPAAQQAESGAPVQRYTNNGDGVMLPNPDGVWCYYQDVLAAQSQGAQALPAAGAGDPDLDAARWAEVFYRNAETFTVRDLGIVRAAWKEATRRATLAAKDEAPAPRTELSKRIREAATADFTLAQAKLLIGAAEEIERAQQAAAPGASIDTPEFRELLAKVWNGAHPRYKLKSVAALVAHIDSRAAQQAAAPGALAVLRDGYASGFFASSPQDGDGQFTLHYATAQQAEAAFMAITSLIESSAPGTPEAPAENRHPLQPLVEDARGTVRFKANAIIVHLTRDKLNDLASMDFSTEDREQSAQLIGYSLGGFAELSYVTDETYDRAAAQPVVPRAAQLDGGQGEGGNQNAQ